MVLLYLLGLILILFVLFIENPLFLSDCNNQIWSITVTSSEFCQLTTDYTFDIEVQDTPPSVDQGIPNREVSVNTPGWSYQFPSNSFDDDDDSTLIYNSTLIDDSALPIWLNLDSSSRTFSENVARDNCAEILNIKVTSNDSCSI